MPKNAFLRYLLLIAVIVVGGTVCYFGYGHYPLGFAAGAALAFGGIMGCFMRPRH